MPQTRQDVFNLGVPLELPDVRADENLRRAALFAQLQAQMNQGGGITIRGGLGMPPPLGGQADRAYREAKAIHDAKPLGFSFDSARSAPAPSGLPAGFYSGPPPSNMPQFVDIAPAGALQQILNSSGAGGGSSGQRALAGARAEAAPSLDQSLADAEKTALAGDDLQQLINARDRLKTILKETGPNERLSQEQENEVRTILAQNPKTTQLFKDVSSSMGVRGQSDPRNAKEILQGVVARLGIIWAFGSMAPVAAMGVAGKALYDKLFAKPALGDIVNSALPAIGGAIGGAPEEILSSLLGGADPAMMASQSQDIGQRVLAQPDSRFGRGGVLQGGFALGPDNGREAYQQNLNSEILRQLAGRGVGDPTAISTQGGFALGPDNGREAYQQNLNSEILRQLAGDPTAISTPSAFQSNYPIPDDAFLFGNPNAQRRNRPVPILQELLDRQENPNLIQAGARFGGHIFKTAYKPGLDDVAKRKADVKLQQSLNAMNKIFAGAMNASPDTNGNGIPDLIDSQIRLEATKIADLTGMPAYGVIRRLGSIYSSQHGK